MHYYKRNIGDYHKKAGRLSVLQHGAYTLLIDACYDREVFPTFDDAIDWVWASSTAEVDAVTFVLKKFFTEIDGFYVQGRIQEDLDKYHANSLTNKRIAIEREKKKKETKGKVKSTKRERVVNESIDSKHEAPPNQEPLTTNQEPLTKVKETMPAKTGQALEIFNHWKLVMKKSNNSLLNAKRTKAITARLKEGYTVEQIKLAITGCSMTPHNMGQNDNGKKYDDLELICRDGVQVERFANNTHSVQKKDINSIGTNFTKPDGWN